MTQTSLTEGQTLKFKGGCDGCTETAKVTVGPEGLTVDAIPVCGVCSKVMVRDTEASPAALSAQQDKEIQAAIDEYRKDNPHSRMVR